jgi:hypothetical protein
MKTHQYVSNQVGSKIAVILPIKEYQALLDKVEELEDIRLFDEAKKRKSEPIRAKEAFEILDRKRQK